MILAITGIPLNALVAAVIIFAKELHPRTSPHTHMAWTLGIGMSIF